MGRLALAILVATGCGRIEFDPRSDAVMTRNDGSSDAPTNPLIASYSFDAFAGTTALDGTGHGHDATCGTVSTCPGMLNSTRGPAATFDGNSDMFMVASAAELENLASFTVALWINPTSPSNCIIGKLVGTGTGNSWQLCSDTGPVLTFYTEDATATDALDGSVGALTAGVWNHIAIRVDDAGLKSMFVNGALDRAGAAPVTVRWDSGDITIGGDLDGAAPVYWFSGDIDDVRIYRGAMSDAFIATLATM